MNVIALVVILVLAVIAVADNTEDEEPKAVTEEIGITLDHCHPGDLAMIHIIPIPKNANRREGYFTTTVSILKLSDLSMLPSGLNRLEIRTICRGLTSEVHSAIFDLQRPPPKPKVGRTLLNDTNTYSPPPMPPGMIQITPLPNADTNHGTYKDLQIMKRFYEKKGRRSQ